MTLYTYIGKVEVGEFSAIRPSKRDIGQLRYGGETFQDDHFLLNVYRLDQASVTLVNRDMKEKLARNISPCACRLDQASMMLVS